jgi:hypothetical protein
VLGHPAVTVVTPATSQARHLADNLEAGHGRLPDAATRRRMASSWTRCRGRRLTMTGLSPQPIPEWRGADERTIRAEVFMRYRPAVLRGLVTEWPAVKAALASPADLARYLTALDSGKPWMPS